MTTWDDFLGEQPESGPHPLDSHEEQSRLRLMLRDGSIIEGLYNPIAQRHYLHCTGRHLPPMGKVEGPLLAADILAVEIVQTREEIREQGRELLYGPRVPGRELAHCIHGDGRNRCFSMQDQCATWKGLVAEFATALRLERLAPRDFLIILPRSTHKTG